MNTNQHDPVVVGIDGSEEATRAIAYGAWEADRRGAPLRLVLAYQPTPMWGPAVLKPTDYVHEQPWVGEVLARAEKQVREAYPDLTVEAVSITGSAAGTLVDESHHAGLVVVGTRAAGGLAGHLNGSVAVQVATHANSPVIAVRGRHTADEPARTGAPVVVGLDGSAESTAAMGFAVEQAIARHADVHAVFAWDVESVHNVGPLSPETFSVREAQQTAERLLGEVTAGWSDRYPDLTIVDRPRFDHEPVSALVDEGADAGLIVVGRRGHGGFLGLRLGSTVDGIVRYAPAPVAVVPANYTTRS
jgi:nucleotide-binding universal stress UspA family protein